MLFQRYRLQYRRSHKKADFKKASLDYSFFKRKYVAYVGARRSWEIVRNIYPLLAPPE